MTGSKRAPRDFIKERAERMGVDVDDLLVLTRVNDPFWTGTSTDHAKAQWFTKYYRSAVADREDDRIHNRGVHYHIVYDLGGCDPPTNRTNWDVYENSKTCVSYLNEASKVARILGYIPIGNIIDEKVDRATVTEYGDHNTEPNVWRAPKNLGFSVPGIPDVDDTADVNWDEEPIEYLADRLADRLCHSIEIDKARQAPYHVELWSEKTLPPSVKREAKRHNANVIIEGQGQLSWGIASEFARRVNNAGKPAVVLYLSDFDPAGDEMAASMSAKLEWLRQYDELDHDVAVKQGAIRQDQIGKYDLGPRAPIAVDKLTDAGDTNPYHTKVNDWEERKGAGAVELNVLETDIDLFKRIIRDELKPLQAENRYSENSDARAEYKDELRDALKEELEHSDLPDRIDDLQSWCESFNNTLSEAKEIFERLHDLRDDPEGGYQEWNDTVNSFLEDLDGELPEFDVPELDGDLPSNPLYDSRREYVENVAEMHAHKHGDREVTQ